MLFHSRDIPLNRIKLNRRISGDLNASDQVMHYVSALAFKLAQSYHQPPAVLSEKIAAAFQQFQASAGAETSDQILQKFTVSVAAPGWLHFQLSAAGIATWLQQLLDAAQEPLLTDLPAVAEIDPHAASIWPLLLTYARCSVFLRQAERARLTLDSPHWLNAVGTLRAQQSAEWHLIEQISDTLDELVKPSIPVKQALKVAVGLSEAFQTFDAHCRILGAWRSDPSLAEVRLGLVQITQSLLRLVLEQRLGLVAPLEL